MAPQNRHSGADSKPPLVLRSKVVVLSAMRKGRKKFGQVRVMKLNESEELTKRRYDEVL
jgi:hypothetical protein